jgi:aldehyde dehydrogenase (NAD+)
LIVAGTIVDAAKESQRRWAARSLPERLGVLRAARHALALRSGDLADAISPLLVRSRSDTLLGEVFPLLEACKFLECEAPRILKTRRLGMSGRPLWLSGVCAEAHREPIGHVLVIGPANFPLFVPGTQVLQALAAGNSVTWKPGNGGGKIAELVATILRDAGLSQGVLRMTGESVEDGREAVRSGADKVVFTGSPAGGRAVLRELAETQTPAVMELSGTDAIVVLPSANLQRVAKAVAFGLRLNGSAVCMSPRRLFADAATLTALRPLLQDELAKVLPVVLGEGVSARLSALLIEATRGGASVWGEFEPAQQSPLLVDRAEATMEITRSDFFAPVLSLIEVPSMISVPELHAQSPFGLTAAIFGDETEARAMAATLRAGTVLINDVIAPTADPRVAFGGRGASGYGVTRGAEGLLEMTALKMLLVQRGRATWYMDPTRDTDAPMFEAAIRVMHGRSWRQRFTAAATVLKAFKKYSTGK